MFMSMNPPHQKTDRYHHGNLHPAVLELGLATLRHTRAADLSVRNLASQLGVSDTAIYRYFRNKDSLLVVLAVEGFKRLSQAQIDAFAAAMARGDAEEAAFRAGGLAYVRFAREHTELFRLMFGGLTERGADNAELARVRRDNSVLTADAIRRLLGGKVDQRRLRAYSVGVRSFVHGMSVLWIDGYLDDLARNDEEIEALAIEAFEGAVRAMRGAQEGANAAASQK
jgi:AcrR family transcriptional regulator